MVFPFALTQSLALEDYQRLATAIGLVPRFDCIFGSVGWFGEDCVWLRPDNDGPFRELTDAVWNAFPDYPPYEGAFDDVVPHLTIGERRFGTLEDLRHAATDVKNHLPIRQYISEALLIAGTDTPNSWHVARRFPLGD